MTQANQNSIVIRDVSHTYGNGTRALEHVDLEIGIGLFGMLGANGAGKSTLMRIMCTLLAPESGTVTMGGYDVVKDRAIVRGLFGYLPQEFGAWGAHSVEAVLETLAALSGLDRKTTQRRCAEVLESVGLREVAGRKVKKLSGGMLRRLGVAQALIHAPKILILDEPTVGLDPEERLRFRQLISELSRERVVILSTHIVADLGASCSQMALIHEGRVEFRGAPAAIIAQARGRIFEIAASPEVAQQWESKPDTQIVSRYYRDGKCVLRGVGRNGFNPQDATIAENITLEEAYVAFTFDKGRKVDAGAMRN